tara:strand:- start:28444 stop:28872 length:429 start_codon:yes stop_codon:yes gene_type:complete
MDEAFNSSFDDSFNEELEEISKVDVRELAISSILSFFEDREYESGGSIPRGVLLREENIGKIFRFIPAYMFVEGLDLIHEILDQNDPPDDFEESSLVDWEIKFLTELMQQSAKAGIPKAFAIGITLLNLEYCYGMSQWRIWN